MNVSFLESWMPAITNHSEDPELPPLNYVRYRWYWLMCSTPGEWYSTVSESSSPVCLRSISPWQFDCKSVKSVLRLTQSSKPSSRNSGTVRWSKMLRFLLLLELDASVLSLRRPSFSPSKRRRRTLRIRLLRIRRMWLRRRRTFFFCTRSWTSSNPSFTFDWTVAYVSNTKSTNRSE